MAKRLTDTAKWDRQWFREMPVEYKMFWNYLCDRCDHAGIWHKDLGIASFFIGAQIDAEKALVYFGDRVKVISDEKWFVARFISFQYGKYHQNKSVHKAVMSRLVASGLRWPSQALAKEMAADSHKDKDKDIDMAKAKGRAKASVGGSRGA